MKLARYTNNYSMPIRRTGLTLMLLFAQIALWGQTLGPRNAPEPGDASNAILVFPLDWPDTLAYPVYGTSDQVFDFRSIDDVIRTEDIPYRDYERYTSHYELDSGTRLARSVPPESNVASGVTLDGVPADAIFYSRSSLRSVFGYGISPFEGRVGAILENRRDGIYEIGYHRKDEGLYREVVLHRTPLLLLPYNMSLGDTLNQVGVLFGDYGFDQGVNLDILEFHQEYVYQSTGRVETFFGSYDDVVVLSEHSLDTVYRYDGSGIYTQGRYTYHYYVTDHFLPIVTQQYSSMLDTATGTFIPFEEPVVDFNIPTFVDLTSLGEVLDQEVEWKVFPNPCVETFSVELPEIMNTGPVEVQMVNAAGQIVLRRNVKIIPAGTRPLRFDLPDVLPAGVYTVVVNANGYVAAKQLVVGG